MIDQAQSPATILLVEDSDTDFELVSWAARQTRPACRVERAPSRHALSQYIEQNPLDVHLVMVDIRLPDVCGLDLLKELRARPLFQQTPIVMFTSSSDPEDMSRAKAAGANDYFVKPSEVPAFVETVEQIVGQWVKPQPSRREDAG